MKTKELVRFLKDLVPPLTPVLILAAFDVFLAGKSEPAPPAGAPLPLAPFTELAATIPTGLFFIEV